MILLAQTCLRLTLLLQVALLRLRLSQLVDYRSLAKLLKKLNDILDWKEMNLVLKDVDFSGMISLELVNPSYWEEGLVEVTRLGLEKMESVLNK